MGAAVSHPSLSASSTHHQQLWGKEGGTRRRGSGRAGKNRGSTAQGLKGVGTTSSPPVDILASPCEVEEGRGGGVKGGGEGRDKKAREGERVEGSRIGEAGAPGVRFVATEGLGDPQAEHEVFTPSYAAYTPSSRKTHGLSYKSPERRQRHVLAPPSSVSRPNVDDALRRVSVVLHQHIATCEGRLARLKALRRRQRQRRRQVRAERKDALRSRRQQLLEESSSHVPRAASPSLSILSSSSSHSDDELLDDEASLSTTQEDEDEDVDEEVEGEEEEEIKMFDRTKMKLFREEEFVSPQYLYRFVRVPIARPGICYSMKQIKTPYHLPSLHEIYHFLRTLFKKAALSSECALVCLIYVERLMEVAHVPLVAITWRAIVLCGLLLASKVWQDLPSWNVEFSQIFPQFSLQSINRLERLFINQLKWDLYISSSLYAKYYFALRSLYEQKDIRRRYNAFVLEGSLFHARPPPPHPPCHQTSLPGNVPKADEISMRTGVVADDLRDLFSKSV